SSVASLNGPIYHLSFYLHLMPVNDEEIVDNKLFSNTRNLVFAYKNMEKIKKGSPGRGPHGVDVFGSQTRP
ncbi:MAG: hypothetical protein U9R75_02580, partial [Candidatus Thermoplasmatota archaeon]|nr:hypothetical protein [Candidatus Thermoplasmatota archaeon]